MAGNRRNRRARLEELGYRTSESELAECYRLAIERADSAKQVSDRDLLAIIHRVRRVGVSEEARHDASTAATH